MSRLYYDHLIEFEQLEQEIKAIVETLEEREELWHLIDEIIHHRVLGCVLNNLHLDYHEEFLCKFHQCPHDSILLEFLKEKVDEDIEQVIKHELENLNFELLEELRS